MSDEVLVVKDDARLAARLGAAVGAVVDPELRMTLAELRMVREASVSEGFGRVEIALTVVGCPAAGRIESEVTAAAASVAGLSGFEVSMSVMTSDERRRLNERLRNGRPARTSAFGPDSLTRVIAVSSGKGGVGKSTLTANLAIELARLGLSVGLVDADIHGFSIPAIMGLVDESGHVAKPTKIDELIVPPVAHGVKTISIGMFLRDGEERAPVAWRGPMLHRTVQQFLSDVYFGDLDVLLIDMPPGTGDVAISISQLLPHAQVIVVTTPQEAAASVAVRSGMLATQTGQQLIGVIENMGPMVMPDGSELALFGSGGGSLAAAELSSSEREVPLIASVPLSLRLREGGDVGDPIVLADPDDPAARAISAAALKISKREGSLRGRSLPIHLA